MAAVTEAELARFVAAIACTLRRMACLRDHLDEARCLELAETARDLADRLDSGEGDRLQHQLRKKLVFVRERGPYGRPLYRLL
jgi:hypothetical protein